jgi:hypothetical protein
MKSAETRAKQIVVKLVDLLRLDNLVQENTEFLETFLTTEFKKHERDTRYKALDRVENSWYDSIDFDEIVSAIQNLEVGDD